MEGSMHKTFPEFEEYVRTHESLHGPKSVKYSDGKWVLIQPDGKEVWRHNRETGLVERRN